MTAEELYLANENLVYHVLKKYFPDKLFDEDIQQIGRMELWKACISFDPERGKFSSYACPCIRNAIAMELRSRKRTKRKGGENDIHISFDAPIKKVKNDQIRLADTIPGDLDVGFFDLEGFWESLTKKEREIANELMLGKNQTQIGKDLGISRSYVSKLACQIRKKWAQYI